MVNHMRTLTRLAILILSCLLLSNCVTQIERSKTQEIIYYKLGTNLIDVFNTSIPWDSGEDIEYLERRDMRYGEFGGPFSFCSNARFHCLHGGLSVVIPKGEIVEKKWAFEGIECFLHSSSDNMSEITCNRNNLWTKFTYSEESGIVRYVRSGDPDEPYILLGTKGLFAN